MKYLYISHITVPSKQESSSCVTDFGALYFLWQEKNRANALH